MQGPAAPSQAWDALCRVFVRTHIGFRVHRVSGLGFIGSRVHRVSGLLSRALQGGWSKFWGVLVASEVLRVALNAIVTGSPHPQTLRACG